MLYLIPINDPEEETSTTYYAVSTGRKSKWRNDKRLLKQFLVAYGVPKSETGRVLKELGFTRNYHATGKHPETDNGTASGRTDTASEEAGSEVCSMPEAVH